MSGPRVLVADADTDARETTVGRLRDAIDGATVDGAASLAEARAYLSERTPDVVVTEYDLGDGTGLDLAAHVRSHTPDVGCLLHTNATDIDTDSFEDTVVEYVPKDDDRPLALAVEAAGTDYSHAAYPVPDDEAERLAAVERYVDDSEGLVAPLARITGLAADHFGVEVASVNVIREHTQEFLTAHGHEWAPTARDDSICTHTIVEDRTMAVPDTAADPRFADDDALREAGIHAYLGANLRTPEGHVIGSLCVYDDEPRAFSDADEDYLASLADVAMDVFALHRRAREGGRGEGS